MMYQKDFENRKGASSCTMNSSFQDAPPASNSRCPRDRHSMPIFVSPDCPLHAHSSLMLVSSRPSTARIGRVMDLDGFQDTRLDNTSVCYIGNVAFAFGLCKLFSGVITFLLGIGAVVIKATMSNIGAGMAASLSTILCGVAALMTSRAPHSYATLTAFVCWSIASLSTSGLLFAFSMTGLVKGMSIRLPTKVHLVRCSFDNCFVDRNSTNIGTMSPVTGDDVSSRMQNALFHVGYPETICVAALCVVAAMDCLISIASIMLVCTSTCRFRQASYTNMDEHKLQVSKFISEQVVRRDRLLWWLQQQQRLHTLDLSEVGGPIHHS